jgi:type I restriction enzyme S subunit
MTMVVNRDSRWQSANLGDVIELFDHKRVPLNSRERQARHGQYPYYGAQGIIDHIDGYIFEGRYILVAEDGENLNSKKLPLALFAKGKFWVNNHAHILRAKSDVADDTFLLACLNNADINPFVTGAAQPKLSQANLRLIEIPLPPLPTQRRIASILFAYDELIENNQRRIRILEEMARSLYREWFVHFRYPGHESVPLVDSPLRQIPQGWEVKAIQQFGKVITGKTPSKANADFYGADVPFVKTPDMHGNMFILSTGEKLSAAGAESQSNKTIPAGSLCVSCIGTIGVVSITAEDCQTNQQINSVVLCNENYREFLFFHLQDSKQAMENLGSNGATMGNVNKSKFESMKVVAPPNALFERYHQLVAPMFTEIRTLAIQTANLRRTRDLLLPRLLSGQIQTRHVNEC